MPRIRRYYPASHALNRDPEFLTLRTRFADWMGYVWHEMLAWGDHTEGELKGETASIALSLSSVSLSKRPQSAAKLILKAFIYMEDCGWIRVETNRVLILNHAKFHNSQDVNKIPDGETKSPLLPSDLPILPTNQTKEEKEEESSCAEFSNSARREPAKLNGHLARVKNGIEPPTEAVTLAEKLKASIFANIPHARAPTDSDVRGWAKELDLLHRKDGKSWQQIEWLLAWSQQDAFWKTVILSGGTFREKWNKLLVRAQSEQPQHSPPLSEADYSQEPEIVRLARESKEKKHGH